MPDCTMTFLDPSLLDDVAFHPCGESEERERERERTQRSILYS